MAAVTCVECGLVLEDSDGICPHCGNLSGGLGRAVEVKRKDGRSSGISVVPLLKASAQQPPPPKLELEGSYTPQGDPGSFFDLPEGALELARERPAAAPPAAEPFEPAAPPPPRAGGASSPKGSPALLWGGVAVGLLALLAVAYLLGR